jgi:hypothetical protein
MPDTLPPRPTPVTPLTGLRALQAARDSAADEIARALQAVIPRDFRGVLTIHIANGVVRREDVTFELRPPQAR